MVTETQKRIEAYQSLLPGIREKVTAVALLLALSVIMLTSASFAWLTISRAPEVSSVTTNIAANGNLEIALATGDGTTPPGESQVGDSAAAMEQTGKTIQDVNKTWGNLVNLGDPSYALDKIVLRPAQLLNDNLNISPLTAAMYDEDGRVIKTSSNFGYAKWRSDENMAEGGLFEMTEEFGIRAISSVTSKDTNTIGSQADNKINDASNANSEALRVYRDLNDYKESLANIVQVYAQNKVDSKLGGGGTVYVTVDQLKDLVATYDQLIAAYKAEAEAIAQSINAQYFLVNTKSTVNITGEQVLTMTGSSSKKDQVYRDGTALAAEYENKDFGKHTIQIKNFYEFITNYNTIVADRNYLQDNFVANNQQAEFDGENGIFKYVDKLVGVDSCLIEGTPVGQLTSNITGALSMLNQKNISVVIQNGILKNFENRLGDGITMEAKITIDVPLAGKKSPLAKITTNAKENYFASDVATLRTLYDFGVEKGLYAKPEKVAGDTYGLAVDLWVRTNASNSYLILEGKPQYSETGREVVLTTEDAKGNTVPVYIVSRSETGTLEGADVTITNKYKIYKSEATLWYKCNISGENEDYEISVTDEEIVLQSGDAPSKTGEKITVDGKETDVYTLSRDGETYLIVQKTEEVWFKVEDGSRFELNEGETPEEAKEMVYDIIGFEGENRVWGDDGLLSTELTTQGMGSCYVFYPDSPENHKRSLELIKSLEVAFVDGSGTLLTKAFMDTENAYEDNGRVTVPLVIDPDADSIGTDADGEEIRAITSLEKNEATRITAIVYLNGENLGNEDVLEKGKIQGQLNIQFGSSQSLVPIDNEKLELSETKVSAEVSKNSFALGDDLTTTVTVTVDSNTEPKIVKAFFLRSINGTQGTREEDFLLTKNSEGKWVSNYTFDAPGKYILRTVIVDGQEYVIKNAPEVNIEGLSVTSVVCSGVKDGTMAIMTAESSANAEITVTFKSGDNLPGKVQGRFTKEDGSVLTVNFTSQDGEIWNGTAKFTTSGKYHFDYLIVDRNHTGITEDKQFTINVKLGMKVRVETTLEDTSFVLDEDKMSEEQKRIGMKVWVMDDTGAELSNLGNTWLYYKKGARDLSTPLIWNGRYYEGVFKPLEATFGKWEFGYALAEGNTIARATEAPVFTFVSPEPPVLGENATPATQYGGFEDAYMGVYISNSDAATVHAIIINEQYPNDELEAEGSQVIESNVALADENDETLWKFIIPAGKTGGQDEGNYVIKELRLIDVYDANGVERTEENPLILTPSNNKTYVYRNVNVTVTNYDPDNDGVPGADYGKNSDGTVTGQAFESHEVETGKFKVSFLNGEGKHLTCSTGNVITDVQLKFYYDASTSAEYGHYDSATAGLSGHVISVELTHQGEGVYQSAKGVDFIYAGEYRTELSYKVAGKVVKTVTVSSDNSNDSLAKTLPVFTVSSNRPTVTVTGVSPAPNEVFDVNTHANAASGGGFTKLSGVSNTFGDDYAVVYIRHTKQTDFIGTWHEYAEPTVTLTLSDIGNVFTSASMTFNNPTAAHTKTYVFTANGLVQTNEIGYAADPGLTDGNPPLYFAGSQTVNELTVVHGDYTFAVPLTNAITINQPQYPKVYAKYKDIKSIEESFDGKTPATVFSIDNETITLTLPSITWVKEEILPREDTTYSNWTTRTIHTDYGYTTYSTGALFWKTTHHDYRPYYWTEFTRTITGSQTPCTTTYRIDSWIINGVEHSVTGNPITLNASGVVEIEAVVTSTVSYGETQTTTTQQVVYGYLQGNDNKRTSQYSYDGKMIGLQGNGEGLYGSPTLGIAECTNGVAQTKNTYTNPDQYLQGNRAG